MVLFSVIYLPIVVPWKILSKIVTANNWKKAGAYLLVSIIVPAAIVSGVFLIYSTAVQVLSPDFDPGGWGGLILLIVSIYVSIPLTLITSVVYFFKHRNNM